MDIVFYEVKLDTPSESEIIEVSEKLFEQLAKSDFSQIGASKDTEINLDGECVNFKLVKLTSDIRQFQLMFLRKFLTSALKASLKKLGKSPSNEEFNEYTYDLSCLITIIEMFENKKLTHFDRSGS